MIRTDDGLVHRALRTEDQDFKGLTVCGLIYTSDRTSISSWLRVAVAVRSTKAPSCLWCIGEEFHP